METTFPALDECDIVRRGPQWAALAPVEARILELLLLHAGRVVHRSEFRVVWPDGMPTPRAVDARLTRLRERIAPLGLEIHSVRSRGLLLNVAQPWDGGRLPAHRPSAHARSVQALAMQALSLQG